MIFARHGMTKRMQAALRIKRDVLRVREEHSARAKAAADNTRLDDAGSDGGGGVIPASGDDWEAFRQTKRGRDVGQQLSRHLRAFVNTRQPRSRNIKPFENLIAPIT